MLVEECVFSVGFCIEEIGASNCHCSHVLGNEPGVDVVEYQDPHDYRDVSVFHRVGSSQEAHDVGGVHLLVKWRRNHYH